jgi:chaperonin GroEL
MQPTDPILGAQARKKILEGVEKVYSVIVPTLGPGGKGVLLPRSYNRGQRVVDDGYYAAENVILKDPHARLSADFFKEGISRSNAQNGDGTTGTGVVGANIIFNVFRDNPLETKAENSAESLATKILGSKKKKNAKTAREIRKELMDGKKLVIEEIKKSAKQIKTLADLEKIAIVSIGKEDEDVAKKVAKLVWETCRDSQGNYVSGHILVTDGFKGDIELEQSHGMKFPAKTAANAFINKPERYEMVAEDVDIFITNYKLDNVHVFNALVDKLRKPKLAIFAPDFSEQVLILMLNLNKNGLSLFPVKCPALRTAQMEDLAAYTDAMVIDKEQGNTLENIAPNCLGFAERIVVKAVENREDAHLSGGKGERIKRGQGNLIDERVKVLTAQLKEARNDVDKGSLEKRISNLHSAGGTIRVGGATEGESKFIKMKIEDGVYACKGALEMGYVKGGGLALKEIAEALPENILTASLKAPYEQIQKNAGGIEIGKDIIDPAKVVIGIVENGVSVAATLITAHAIIPEIPQREPADGHDEIARAIRYAAGLYGKQHSLLKAAEDDAEADRNKEFERAMATDTD